MSAPLSGQFSQEAQNLATGMFGAPRGRIAPRGSYAAQGVGDPAMGYSGYGYFWNQYPSMIGGTSEYQAVSTETGASPSTPDVSTVAQDAGVDGSPTGASVGGTAAY